MLLIGASWGILNGFITSRIGVSSIITTLGTWQIINGVAFQVSSVAIFDLPENLAFFGQGNIAGVPVPAIIIAVVGVISYFVLHYTRYGRAIYAVGGNPASAWLSGINFRSIVATVFVISGILAALAGVIFTARTMSASFRTLVGLELDSIAAAIIGGVSLSGGKGTVIGAILGAFIVGVINNGMSVLNIGGNTAGIVKGAIIITAVTIDLRRGRVR
jgi:ribose/xylose/arabinose/galactoside ABC-type transport system permease subunit